MPRLNILQSEQDLMDHLGVTQQQLQDLPESLEMDLVETSSPKGAEVLRELRRLVTDFGFDPYDLNRPEQWSKDFKLVDYGY
jgi:hypothetical protein